MVLVSNDAIFFIILTDANPSPKSERKHEDPPPQKPKQQPFPTPPLLPPGPAPPSDNGYVSDSNFTAAKGNVYNSRLLLKS